MTVDIEDNGTVEVALAQEILRIAMENKSPLLKALLALNDDANNVNIQWLASIVRGTSGKQENGWSCIKSMVLESEAFENMRRSTEPYTLPQNNGPDYFKYGNIEFYRHAQ